MISQSDPRTIVQRVYDAFNRHDLDAFAECFADDFVDHGDDPPTVGREAGRQHLAAFLSAFPDLHTSVDQVIVDADGDMMSSRTTTTGTHQHELMGIPPTGRRIRVTGVDQARLSDGRIVERWGGLDTFSLLKQLGAIGAPADASAAAKAG